MLVVFSLAIWTLSSQVHGIPAEQVLNPDLYPDVACNTSRPQVLDNLNGVLTSRNFPGNYPSNELCHWHIRAETELTQVHVDLTNFTTEDCYDILRMHDGATDQSTLLASICGNPSNIDKTSSTQRSMSVVFTSDASEERMGWRAKYTTDPACSTHRPSLLTANQGRIVSPYSPESYPNNASCQWRIQAPVGQIVRLNTTSFNIENCCTCDYVDIYDGPNTNSPRFSRHCATNSPPTLVSTSRDMLVVFVTDADVNYDGFVMEYDFLDGQLTTDQPASTTQTTTPTTTTVTMNSVTPTSTTPPTTTTDFTITSPVSSTTLSSSTTPSQNSSDEKLPYLIVRMNGTVYTVSGEAFTQQCAEQYSYTMQAKAKQMTLYMDSIMDSDICSVEGPGFQIGGVDVFSIASGNMLRITQDVIIGGLLYTPFDVHHRCGNNTYTYIANHNNWVDPILPQQPGCPEVYFSTRWFDLSRSRWECLAL